MYNTIIMRRLKDVFSGTHVEGSELEGRDFEELIHRELTAQMDDFLAQISPEHPARKFPLREKKHVWHFDEGKGEQVSLRYEYSINDIIFQNNPYIFKTEKIIGKDPLTGRPLFEYERLTSGEDKQVIMVAARRLPIGHEGVHLFPNAAIGPYINFHNSNYPHTAAITGSWDKIQVCNNSGDVERIQDVTKQDRADILSVVRLRQRGRDIKLRQTAAPR